MNVKILNDVRIQPDGDHEYERPAVHLAKVNLMDIESLQRFDELLSVAIEAELAGEEVLRPRRPLINGRCGAAGGPGSHSHSTVAAHNDRHVDRGHHLIEPGFVRPEAGRSKARVMACEGLLLVTPEYNNGIPGVFKNAIDWLSRPPADTAKVFKNRPVAVIGASPGGFGTILAQNAWLPVLRTLGTRPYFGGRLVMSHAHRAFNDEGGMTDAVTKDRLRDFMRGFVEFTQQNSR